MAELFQSDVTLFGLAMVGLLVTTLAILRDHRPIAGALTAKEHKTVSER